MVETDVFGETLTGLLDAGAPFQVAFYDAVVAELRAEDRVWPAEHDQVECVLCDTLFVFREGATRARCPGCGARYERMQTPRGS